MHIFCFFPCAHFKMTTVRHAFSWEEEDVGGVRAIEIERSWAVLRRRRKKLRLYHNHKERIFTYIGMSVVWCVSSVCVKFTYVNLNGKLVFSYCVLNVIRRKIRKEEKFKIRCKNLFAWKFKFLADKKECQKHARQQKFMQIQAIIESKHFFLMYHHWGGSRRRGAYVTRRLDFTALLLSEQAKAQAPNIIIIIIIIMLQRKRNVGHAAVLSCFCYIAVYN